MIIDKELKKYIVRSHDPLTRALEKISASKMRVAFVVSEEGVLEGVMTDGDLRRWLLQQDDLDLDQPVIEASNEDFVSLPEGTPTDRIQEHFSKKIEHIPLVDDYYRLVAVATQRTPEVDIDGFVINDESPCFVIAEIGNNHNGDFELAKTMIDEAVAAGADCVKFQMRQMDQLYADSSEGDDLGTEYTLDLLEKYQLPDQKLLELFDYCREQETIPLCTPYETASLDKLDQYGLGGFKIASADLTNDELLRATAEKGKPMICSTGMSTESDIRHAVNVLRESGAIFVLLHCNSTYPAPFKDIHLNYLKRLQDIGSCYVGYSGHERGIHVAVAAVALGSKVIEKHFTLDRTMEGRDHKVSLLPDEFAEMVRGIRHVEVALGGEKAGRRMSQGELINRETLAKSLVINRDLKAGQTITSDMLETRSPGVGLPPSRKSLVVGSTAQHDFSEGDFLFDSDLEEGGIGPKDFEFSRPWGLPVRFRDFEDLKELSNPDFLEFHLSYQDLEVDIESTFSDPLNTGFTVHSPELFAEDHVLDLCTGDDEYREHSIQELQRVITLTQQLKQYFPSTPRPVIITNVGGFTPDSHLSAEQKEPLFERLEDSLEQLDMTGVEIIPQTMPPFPWHFGGQRYHNLFVAPDEIATFCRDNDMRICLDVSHSKLACNYFDWSLSNFIRQVSPHTAHLHIADASGLDGEGLQIGTGEIDMRRMAEDLHEHMPDVSFIPEIWQGHKNNGQGFWQALHRLEKHPF